MRGISRFAAIALVAEAVAVPPALAQTFISGSTGVDGAFTPPAGITTLTLPPSGVFNFTTINIGSGAVVKFARNAPNTPVTMLATGNVTIAGIIDVSGASGGAGRSASTIVGGNGGLAGPGGFDGGSGAAAVVSTIGGSGLGPGGGTGSTGQSTAGGGGGGAGHVAAGTSGTGAGAGTGGVTYGTASLLPLVGGSGGGGGGAVATNSGAGGGGGGGALLIASSGTITLTGQILAQGGQGGLAPVQGLASGGGGSGGAVRLVASTITGANGTINIAGGAGNLGGGISGGGSAGRVRVEAFTNTLAVNVGTSTVGVVSSGAPTSVMLPSAPSLRITAVGGVAAPAAPTGSFTIADVVLPPTVTNPVTVGLAAANIPVGTTVTVTVKGLYDAASSAVSTPLAGTLASSTASASVTVPTNEPSVIGASASFMLAAAGGAPLYVSGDEIERVRVTATPAGPSTVSYLTRAGRELPLSPGR
jgi:hypothetical protein